MCGEEKTATQQVLRDGARRIRTADLLGAIQALCQLSYSPVGEEKPLPRAKSGPLFFLNFLEGIRS
jgi:hypothetical protein